jgi:hypothetical protein
MKTNYIIAIVLFLAGMVSCTERIELNLPDSVPTLVVNGCLTDEWGFQKIYLTRSASYFDPAPNPKVSGAVVAVTSSTGEIRDFRESASEPGTYLSVDEMAAVAGETYTLSVACDLDGEGTLRNYSATTVMQTPFEIDSIQVNRLHIMKNNFFSVNLYAQDPPSTDCYLFRCYVNDTIVSPKITHYQITDDRLFNGAYLQGVSVYILADTDEMDNYDAEDIEDWDFIRKGDRLTIEAIRIEQGYSDFLNQCKEGINGASPFSGPPANIITNISNGGVGYFTAFSLTSISKVVED